MTDLVPQLVVVVRLAVVAAAAVALLACRTFSQKVGSIDLQVEAASRST